MEEHLKEPNREIKKQWKKRNKQASACGSLRTRTGSLSHPRYLKKLLCSSHLRIYVQLMWKKKWAVKGVFDPEQTDKKKAKKKKQAMDAMRCGLSTVHHRCVHVKEYKRKRKWEKVRESEQQLWGWGIKKKCTFPHSHRSGHETSLANTWKDKALHWSEIRTHVDSKPEEALDKPPCTSRGFCYRGMLHTDFESWSKEHYLDFTSRHVNVINNTLPTRQQRKCSTDNERKRQRKGRKARGNTCASSPFVLLLFFF